MVSKEQLEQLEQAALQYYDASSRVSFEIEDRQEELDGILLAWQGMNDVSAQVLRQYFLNPDEEAREV